ncbi:MAG: M1 family metallopeptidase [candidate division Zixibacteria bacterium]|nr:M1 family metallopeptidase [candidate division Zixibacteria bacterium]
MNSDVADDQWQPDSAQWHWGRDRQIDLIDTKVDVRLDPAVVRVAGTVTLTFAPILPDLRTVHLDAERLTITQVRDHAGRPIPFTMTDAGFDVEFASPPSTADTTSIQIDYQGEPMMGLYFIPSVPQNPDKSPMIWSQGESEENRFWFPGYDYPNDKATAAVNVTTPRPNVAVANGRMVGLNDNPDGTRTFHWVESVPISTYLIAVAVGAFDSLVEKTSDGLPVIYYCRAGEGETLKRSMGETPGMIEFFSRQIGVPFPFEKYAQVLVTDFIYGGMENASMTIESERALYSVRAADFYRDRENSLIAHELAHQWFGDLLTCNDWAQAWLNEGFATYFDDLWLEHRWGHDRFLLSMVGTHQGGLSAAKGTRRSTVHHRYVHPDDLFSGYAYSRGASVLHMIRGRLGDSLWWAAVHRYVADNRAKTVETDDLKRAVEAVSGRDFDGFFDQWIGHGGHPELKIETSYDTDTRLLRVDVKQTQKVDAVTPVFQFPLEIEWVNGTQRGHETLTIDKTENSVYVPLSEKPQYVLIDPEGWLLADVDYSPSISALLAQATDSVHVLARLRAVQALAKKDKSSEILAALTAVLRHDPFPSIRQAAADALADLGGPDARDSLSVGLDDPDVNTTNRVIYALGRFDGDSTAFNRLQTFARATQSDELRGSAIDAASMIDPDRALPAARVAVAGHTEKYTVETDAFTALRRSKDPLLIDLGLTYARKGHPTAVRSAAVGLVGALAKYEKDDKKRDKASRALEVYLDDRNMNFRRPLMNAIGALGRTEAIPLLERVQRQSPQHAEQNSAKDAIAAIRERKPEDKPNTVARQIDEETQARKKLEERLDDLEKKIEAISKSPAAAKDSTGTPPKPRH